MLKKTIVYASVTIAALIIFDIALYFVYPDVSALKKENPGKTGFMEYREREWAIKGVRKTITQKWVTLRRISPYLIKAVIIAEDDKFWRHEGFDFEAMQQALEKDIEKRQFKAGGSTISQQLAKNLYLSPSKNPIRKIKEAIITWRMERALSKRRIVELYLNVAEWGDGIFGIEAAARHYYGKRASGLDPEEAARLAAVLPNPRRFIANGNSKYVQNRSARIYQIMVARGIVIPEFEEVMAEPEENTKDIAAETPSSKATTGGITPPSGEEAQNKSSEGSNLKMENQTPPAAAAPESGNVNSTAPVQGGGMGTEGAN
ncbi:MAG TPA: monofunctional biosynthetic peptidoglycan transglycosylase [Desulfomonilia bacterium]|nr:monofunctional biosynthetic peptidoglycan transglycosylase [Desulfomonilia bacterium]